MRKLYIIRSPYTGRLITPRQVTSLGCAHDHHLLKEYPPTTHDPNLDYYGVQVPSHELYETELDAYKALTSALMYEIKKLNHNLKDIIL